jgi:hypothetical protein
MAQEFELFQCQLIVSERYLKICGIELQNDERIASQEKIN